MNMFKCSPVGRVRFLLSSAICRSYSMDTQFNGAHLNKLETSKIKTSDMDQKVFEQKVKVHLGAVSNTRFEVRVPFKQSIAAEFKRMESVKFDAKSSIWSFEYPDYFDVVRILKKNIKNMKFSGIPSFVLDVFMNKNQNQNQVDWNRVDEKLRSALMPFQKEGVKFCIRRQGRAIIADDMGLGKTLEAIAVMCHYRNDWPLLVVCPASVKYVWKEAFRDWLSPGSFGCVNIIMSGKDRISMKDDVTIISYDLARKMMSELTLFKAIILDESHYLKGIKTERSKALKSIVKNARRLLLLSGTPAVSRPNELYSQINLLQDIPFYSFGMRYCAGHRTPFGYDFLGASNLTELQLYLQEAFMIRRMKNELLFNEIPTKKRHLVMVASGTDKIDKHSWFSAETEDLREPTVVQFHKAGLFKLKGSIQFILNLLLKSRKLIVFAHHSIVLDTICVALEAKGYQYAKIDGNTSSTVRLRALDKFQQDDDCRVLVVSITAGSAGIDFTTASDVVFAEMFWNPGTLIQAEDRAHRIGQANIVNIYYMMSDYFIDNLMWLLLQKKVAVLTKAGLSMEGFKKPKSDTLKDYYNLHDSVHAGNVTSLGHGWNST